MNIENPQWRNQAACAGEDPEAFYLEDPRSVETAKLICRDCPVQRECVQDAADNEDWWGIRGGLIGPTRRRIASGQNYTNRTHTLQSIATTTLRLTSDGWTAVNIAGYLNVSKRTVERVRNRSRREVTAA